MAIEPMSPAVSGSGQAQNQAIVKVIPVNCAGSGHKQAHSGVLPSVLQFGSGHGVAASGQQLHCPM